MSDLDGPFGHVDDAVLSLNVEVMVVAGIRVEIGQVPAYPHTAQQPGIRELIERVVDGRERHTDAGRIGLAAKSTGGHMAVVRGEQQSGERHALARRPKRGLLKQSANVPRPKGRPPDMLVAQMPLEGC